MDFIKEHRTPNIIPVFMIIQSYFINYELSLIKIDLYNWIVNIVNY